MTDMVEEENIWFPGPYRGREEYRVRLAVEVPENEVIELVQQRVREDGEWVIETGRTSNEPLMRRMMQWAGAEQNILQIMQHVQAEHQHVTLDWMIYELAKAARRIGGVQVHDW